MNKIKAYYDKIILTALLVFFIIVLVLMVWNVKNSEKPVTQEDERALAEMPHNYEISDTARAFRVNNVFARALSWKTATPRGGHKSFTDLAQVYPLVYCTYCGMLIPYVEDYEKNLKCSFCDESLEKREFIDNTKDIDKDGVPDYVWVSLSLDPDLKGKNDYDADGWTNLEEYLLVKESGLNDFSSLTDPKKHPSLIDYLAVSDIRQVPLDFVLNGYSQVDKPEKTTFFLKVNGKNIKPKKIGDEFEVTTPNSSASYVFKILGVKKEPSKDKEVIKMELKCNSTQSVFAVAKGEKNVMHPQKQLEFQFCGKTLPLMYVIGSKIQLGTDRVGKETFTIKAVDSVDVALDNDKGETIQVSETPERTDPLPDFGDGANNTTESTPSTLDEEDDETNEDL